MQQSFHTRQFMAGNSPAIRIPMSMAFEHQAALVVIRDGDRIIVQPQAQTLEALPALFEKLGQRHTKKRPEFVQASRKRDK